MSNWNENERDQRQRSYGFIGLSVMAHVGVLTLLALLPKATQPEMGIAKGNGGSDPVYMEIQKDGTAGAGSQAPEQQTEIADQGQPQAEPAAAPEPMADTQSAATTSSEVPVAAAQVEAPAPATPVEEKVEPQEVKVVPIKVVPVAPVPVKTAKAAAKPASKAAAKLEAPKPAPLSEPQTEIIEDNTSDVQVREALLASRTTAPEEKQVEEIQTAPVVETKKDKPTAVADDSSNSSDEEDDQEDTEIVEEKAPATVAAVVATEEPKKAEATTTQSEAVQEAKPKTAATSNEAPVAASAVATDQPQQAPKNIESVAAGVGSETQAPSGATSNVGTAIAGPAGHGGNGSGAASGMAGGPRPGVAGIPTGTLIRDASDLVAKPGNQAPSYPMEDRRLGRQGANTLLARIQADGTVAEVILEKSSGSPFMDQAAVQAFKKWKFMPGQAGWVRQPFAFNLSGKAQEIPAKLRRR